MVVVEDDQFEFTVMYFEKGKTKLARIDKHYYHRYGPLVLATFNGSRYWFKSGEVGDLLSDSIIEAMKLYHEDEKHPLLQYPPFDVDKISVQF